MTGTEFFDIFLQNHPRKYIHNTFSYIVGGSSKTAFLIFPGSGENDYSCYNLVDHFEKKYKATIIYSQIWHDKSAYSFSYWFSEVTKHS